MCYEGVAVVDMNMIDRYECTAYDLMHALDHQRKMSPIRMILAKNERVGWVQQLPPTHLQGVVVQVQLKLN